MKRKMTFFALAAKCAGFGARGLAGESPRAVGKSAASNPWRLSMEARASMPNPPPALRRNPRRVVGNVLGPPGPEQRVMGNSESGTNDRRRTRMDTKKKLPFVYVRD